MRFIDSLLTRLVQIARWLAVPLVLLLFLQWPLRDLVKGLSREANDLGQIIFAFYVAVAFTAASRSGAHLYSDALAHRYSLAFRRWLAKAGIVIAVIPWAGFILFAGWPMIMRSLGQFEAFPDTSNPGYFLIKCAAGLLALLITAQSLIALFRGRA